MDSEYVIFDKMHYFLLFNAFRIHLIFHYILCNIFEMRVKSMLKIHSVKVRKERIFRIHSQMSHWDTCMVKIEHNQNYSLMH